MDINTKWNHSKKAPLSYVVVHSSDEPRLRAQYLEYSEGTTVGGDPGFYNVDISTRSGIISLYLDNEHIEGLVEDLQQAMVKRQPKDTPVAVCQAG